MKLMNIAISLALGTLAVCLTSCASPPRAFHNTDSTALVIQSFNDQTCQMLQPTASAKISNDELLGEAAKLSQHQTAIVILEDYTDEKIGNEFRDRTTSWVIGLRYLGYPNIVFLKGLGVADPEGLIPITQYY
jgi:hypothetical protein